MAGYILDGKATSQKIKQQVAAEVDKIVASGKRPPCLAVILAGDDKASEIYVRNKQKDCDECGFRSVQIRFGNDVTQQELTDTVRSLGADTDIDGILCQLPLPKGIDKYEILAAIPFTKDVDAFNPYNAGLILQGKPVFEPCTPAGILALLDDYGISVEGRDCVIIGRSDIVGKPLAAMLTARSATVTVCHTRTKDLASHTLRADLIFVAAGRPGLLTGDMIRRGCVVVDVGINRDESGKLCGDCDFESCNRMAAFITPVPGGIGPMTRAMLMQNTLTAYKLNNK